MRHGPKILRVGSLTSDLKREEVIFFVDWFYGGKPSGHCPLLRFSI
jgi:hypothetical protein